MGYGASVHYALPETTCCSKDTFPSQVLCIVREKLHLPEECSPNAPPSTENADLAVLVCSTIRTALLLHRHLTNAWLKVAGV